MPASGRTAREAAVYPVKLCRAILRGCRNQLRRDGLLQLGTRGIVPHRRFKGKPSNIFEDDFVEYESSEDGGEKGQARNIHGGDGSVLTASHTAKPIRDDLTGQPLDPKLVEEARQKELSYF